MFLNLVYVFARWWQYSPIEVIEYVRVEIFDFFLDDVVEIFNTLVNCTIDCVTLLHAWFWGLATSNVPNRLEAVVFFKQTSNLVHGILVSIMEFINSFFSHCRFKYRPWRGHLEFFFVFFVQYSLAVSTWQHTATRGSSGPLSYWPAPISTQLIGHNQQHSLTGLSYDFVSWL